MYMLIKRTNILNNILIPYASHIIHSQAYNVTWATILLYTRDY